MSDPIPSQETILVMGDFASGFRTGSSVPSAYRLVRRNGELILQGCFNWTERDQADHNWMDIPTLEEGPEASLPKPDRPPLWEVMKAAHDEGWGAGLDARCAYGAALRAAARWFVSEADADCIVPDHGRYLSELFLAEADRAETGK